ncbi:UNVERIFIED_CONTAM: hypothetical protein FKN15_043740 [Acipenser sinensis]
MLTQAAGAPPLLAAKAAGARPPLAAGAPPPWVLKTAVSGPPPRTTLQPPQPDPGSMPLRTGGPHKGSPPRRAQTRHWRST